MKNYLALFSIAAALYLGAAYTQPSSPLHKPLTEAVDNTASRLWHGFTALPVVNLLDCHGINDCQHRPTVQPLQVVSPYAAGYTPADLAELYPTH